VSDTYNSCVAMEKEVLSKKRRALMLFGTMHLYHTNQLGPPGLESAVQRYERSYPRTTTFVIGTMIVSRNPISPQAIEEMNKRMASWPAPSLVQNLKGSWLPMWTNTTFQTWWTLTCILAPLT
jgi:hypothetical protein